MIDQQDKLFEGQVNKNSNVIRQNFPEDSKENLKEIQRSESQEWDKQESNLILKSFSLKKSINIDQYAKSFLKGRKPPNLNRFSKNFRQFQVNFLTDVTSPIPVQIQQSCHSKNKRIMHFWVRISMFTVQIKIFNIIQEDGYKIKFTKQISQGVYGVVFQLTNPLNESQQVAVKRIPFTSFNSSKTIQNAIKQYAFLKLLASLQVGPHSTRIFGFDIIVSSQFVMFSMQKGISLNDWVMNNLSKQNIQDQFIKLEQALILLHSLNICHNDIKPCNIIYSKKLKQLVFIDFGFSQVKLQSVGLMVFSSAKGSLYYCSEQMKKVFLTGKQDYVDTYYNDYVCLKKSKQFILRNYLYLDFNSQSHYLCANQIVIAQKNIIFANQLTDIIAIYIQHLIQEKYLQQFELLIEKYDWLSQAIQLSMKKICLFFLQVQSSLGIWQFFTKFSEIFFTQNILINSQIKKIIENLLKPYFKAFLEGYFSSNAISQKYNFKDHAFKEKIIQRFSKAISSGFTQIEHENFLILDLDQESQQKLEYAFKKIKSQKHEIQVEIVEFLSKLFHQRKKWFLISQSDIKMFQKFFLIGNIKISYDKIKNKSNYKIFLLYLQLFGKFVLFIQKNLDIKKTFYNLTVFNFGQTDQVMKQLKKVQLFSNQNKNQSQNKKQKESIYASHHQFELLQLYIFVSWRIIEVIVKNLSAEKGILFLQKYVSSMDIHIVEAIKFKQKILKSQKLVKIIPVIETLLQKYVIFRHEAGLKGYIVAYGQMNFETICYFHNTLLRISQSESQQSKESSQIKLINGKLSQIIYSHTMVNLTNQFVDLFTFAQLVPISLHRKYHIIQKFKIFYQRTKQNQIYSNCDYLKIIQVNVISKIFLLSLAQDRIMQALLMVDQIVKQQLSQSNQEMCFSIQILLKRLNNSKKSKELSKKLQQFKFQQFISYDKNLTAQNALILLQNQRQIYQENQLKLPHHISSQKQRQQLDESSSNVPKQIINDKAQYLSEINSMWNKLSISLQYQNKFALKLYMMRQTLQKIIMIGQPLDKYIQDYIAVLNLYEKYIQNKFNQTQNLPKTLIHFVNQNQKNIQNFIYQAKGQFILQQKIYFIETIFSVYERNIYRNQQKIVSFIQTIWNQNYISYFQQVSKKILFSNQIRKSHMQLICRYCEMNYKNQHYLVNSKKSTQAYNQFVQKQKLMAQKQLYQKSLSQYLIFCTKETLNSRYYILILLALYKKNLKLDNYSFQTVKIQLKNSFYQMIQNHKIYKFFYFQRFSQQFLQVLLQISIQQIIQNAKKNFKTTEHYSNLSRFEVSKLQNKTKTDYNQKWNSILESDYNSSSRSYEKEFHSYDSQILNSFDQKSQKSVKYQKFARLYSIDDSASTQINSYYQAKEKLPIFQSIFFYTCAFIKNNQCYSYSKWLVELSIQSKNIFKQKFQQIKPYHAQTFKQIVSHSLNNLYLSFVKLITNQLSYESLLVIMNVLLLKLDFELRIQEKQLQTLSKYICQLKYLCKDMANHFYNFISHSYYMNRAKQLIKNKFRQRWNEDQNKLYIKVRNKERFYQRNHFRKYKGNYFNDCWEKQLQRFLKRIKQKQDLTQNSQKSHFLTQKLLEKIRRYIFISIQQSKNMKFKCKKQI